MPVSSEDYDMIASRCWSIVVGLAILILPGCAQPEFTFVSVEGTLARDGKPLEGVLVVFYPDGKAGTVGPRSSGITDAAGKFRLTVDAPPHVGKDGAIPGQHRVVLQVESETRQAKEFADYGDYAGTKLRAEVKLDGVQTVDLQIP